MKGVVAVLGVIAVALVLAPVHSELGETWAAVCVLGAILVVALTAGSGAALVAIGPAAALLVFFFAAPVDNLAVERSGDVVVLLVFVQVAVVVALGVGRFRDRRAPKGGVEVLERAELNRLAVASLAELHVAGGRLRALIGRLEAAAEADESPDPVRRVVAPRPPGAA